ncbi:MAG: malate synthase G [Candidatus Eutrophobiaceae bacterium]
MNYAKIATDLEADSKLIEFIEEELCPGSGVSSEQFWHGLASIVADMGEENNELLKKRETLQKHIDNWHLENRGSPHDSAKLQQFLEEIGYLEREMPDFEILTHGCDPEVAQLPGPQLVAPLDNSRYVLNAANARWGSLYDALYVTNAISEADGCQRIQKYNPVRGDRVIAFCRNFLDQHVPLESSTHCHVTRYVIEHGELRAHMGNGRVCTLLRPHQFIGWSGERGERPDALLLRNHGLHIEIRLGEGYFIGRRDHANIYDIRIEAALTSIMDCEDSVVSVDVEDKLHVYRNWLKLMHGTLTRSVVKDDKERVCKLESDRKYFCPDGKTLSMPGRSLMLVRNVGNHLHTAAVRFQGRDIPETMLDLMVTALAGKHDLLGNSALRNSRARSIYIVKPKMHGSTEVAHANRLFQRTEDILGLKRNTLKMGIMDEERRTSVNLKNCIHAACERVFFINTGFLDRTGDDIHTNMEAGPTLSKDALKEASWLRAYEAFNASVGMHCGFSGRAQIGKGMWAMPDAMKEMLHIKIQHLKAGATTAWVPSPTAAVLHALHYHRLDVADRQRALRDMPPVKRDGILDIPLLDAENLPDVQTLRYDLESNSQSILGYVSRWVGQGIGCSKVPNLKDVALMEDCATLRISSQHIANWLCHGLVDEEMVRKVMQRMAVIVDRQNRDEPGYLPMSPNFDSSLAFQAALDLVFKGRRQPNGYTEHILYHYRRKQKEHDTQ